ncbi:hypothetical protein C1922_19700 [Stenotrophomonas sp. ZAC14D2_NAIMI4_7]|uniref:nucleotidyl transferase AbiEii/AbiGii toxin family protein n=1 Tax=Stenotrophomonas sp. ZAC14D2_NAIMI4_7 TaxID=2072405 RepID=UPI000D53FA8F|nr:nucleotidyl transferase AbiEii/AbiGii toxin family protein [Stenotrophomonas sp. ZAC14D2_NAIMI4_7]AWH19381.1 hypothetical protein C1922_19700 [Stenotrophomonas sp. ZAC14D2_NAIMI4_7]
MSSLLENIPTWVESAPAAERNFRKAVHVVLHAIATDRRLSQLLCLKGGILMALHYRSERYTTDIDFSTKDPFSVSAEEETKALLETRLASASEDLGYDIDCRLQRWDVQPGRDKTYVSIFMKVGYAVRGSRAHPRLIRGESAETVSIDYNYLESIPQIEEVSIGSDGVLRVYALPTLVAEKIRSLIQQPIRKRNRRQDVYDLRHLLLERPELYGDECRRIVVEDIIIKCADRDVPVGPTSLNQKDVHDMALKEYNFLQDEISGELPEFEEAYELVRSYFSNLPWPLLSDNANADSGIPADLSI